jgi:hypothetical protein
VKPGLLASTLAAYRMSRKRFPIITSQEGDE